MGRSQGKGGNVYSRIYFRGSLMGTTDYSRWQFDDGEGNIFAWSVTNKQLEVSKMNVAGVGRFE